MCTMYPMEGFMAAHWINVVLAEFVDTDTCDVPHWFDEDIAQAFTRPNQQTFVANTSAKAANDPNFTRVAP